jgi:uncharacterized membrane protein
MTAICAILLVYILYRIIRSTIHGRMWPWILALAALIVIIAGTVGNV